MQARPSTWPRHAAIASLTSMGSLKVVRLQRKAELRRREELSPRRLVLEQLRWEDPLEGADAARAELRARGALELVHRLLGGAGSAVDPRRQHRVERVGDVDDPGAERDVLAA